MSSFRCGASGKDSMNRQSEYKEPDGQACAIPYRQRKGKLEFCLITSSKGHWSFPKGFVELGESLRQAALKEAFELLTLALKGI